MNELIKIEPRQIAGATVPTCNARDLWQFVESKAQFAAVFLHADSPPAIRR